MSGYQSPNAVVFVDSQAFANELLTLAGNIRGNASRKAVNAGCKPMVAAYTALLKAEHSGKGPAVRLNKATGEFEVRPPLWTLPSSKVWKFPDGMGYAGIIGAKAGNARTAHLVENQTAPRMRKRIGGHFAFVEDQIASGQKPPETRRTGVMLSHRPETAHPLQRAFNATQNECLSVMEAAYYSALQEKVSG